jgi:hypothetical protein
MLMLSTETFASLDSTLFDKQAVWDVDGALERKDKAGSRADELSTSSQIGNVAVSGVGGDMVLVIDTAMLEVDAALLMRVTAVSRAKSVSSTCSGNAALSGIGGGLMLEVDAGIILY